MTCQVIRVGVFFDGTGNNLSNDEAGRSKNGVSNIGKLYRLYRDGERFEGQKITECEVTVKAIYIEGVGTKNGEDDYSTGGAFGALGGQRIRRAITQVKAIFAKYPAREYQQQIDVFGFSRGAAMARDFINSLANEEVKLKYQIKFVGIFDTVGSFGYPGNDQNWKPKTDKYTETDLLIEDKFGMKAPEKYFEPYNFNLSPKSAEQIVHFVAMDEYRKNFPLTDTNGVGLTYEFIGAHSDVGGGYAKIEKEKIAVMGLNKSEAELTAPNKYGIQIGENWTCYSLDDLVDDELPYCNGTRTITDDLQKVALVAMHRLALRAGVPFKESIKSLYPDIPEYDPAEMASLNWTQELQDYFAVAVENISELRDFLNEGEKLNNGAKGELRTDRNIPHLKILAKYGHNSSGIFKGDIYRPAPLGFYPRIYNFTAEDIAKSPINRVKDVPKRNVFHNNVKQAIVKA
ncbi:T6SS phospholipase effector Tle1-like catalytic domain-containing protein [Rodentibacter myodis]|uniref:T6SS Phospholipase effector Tle1-like catalytic domain-containing protein n=1 Tax=Rodentibacter myodis TaxID=1907939 RepID=A0A1V3JT89_9PAST|nr:DUF2235 domain-containing protein [Rodentibacter myodis]OOF59993.1 hypothetical protein BKL49_01400 [Rodentibacter myodis]